MSSTPFVFGKATAKKLASFFLSAALLAFLYGCFPARAVDPSANVAAKYQTACAQCHTTGLFSAPISFNQSQWQPRLDKGMDVLLANVESGMGLFMPANGGCQNCTQADFEALIRYMASEKPDP